MQIHPDADSATVARRLAESGKKVTDVCKHSCPEKLELGSDSRVERSRAVNSRFDRLSARSGR
jgi:hypothetical protein